jgi:hypothetical protein
MNGWMLNAFFEMHADIFESNPAILPVNPFGYENISLFRHCQKNWTSVETCY